MDMFQNYGQERDVNATEEEVKIFEQLTALPGCEDIRLVRKSDSYVSAVLGDWDLARFKYTLKAKWITFPTIESSKSKHQLESPENVADLADMVADSVAHIAKY